MVQPSSLNKVIVIAGPTAIGKTSISLEIAQRYNGEIVSADSMQIYRGMNIGTGKIDLNKTTIPHYMIDIVNPDEFFTVSDYVSQASAAIEHILQVNKIPLIVGGTGLYIDALLHGYDFAGTCGNAKVREKYNHILLNHGKDFLFKMLKDVDAETAEKISSNDVKRVIRALEIYELTGEPKSKQKTQKTNNYDSLIIILNEDRQILYDRINARVELMFSLGLVDEVAALIKYRDCNSMQGIGYKETLEYIDNKIDLNTAIECVKQNSRRYAKRQLTFFRHFSQNIFWVSPMDKITIYKLIEDFLNNI